MKELNPWHVGVAAEAFVAAQFARFAFDVSVQYGANQPEYDLVVISKDKMLKISVKGSKDGGWGLTQKYKKDHTYHEAIEEWLKNHHKKTVFCLVQFEGVGDYEIPRMYLASPQEIADVLNKESKGRGDTILYENHEWSSRAFASGTVDKIPNSWNFTKERAEEMFNLYGI